MSTQGKPLRCEIIHDNFQNYKKYNVPKAQLVIADIPYNIGADAYGSNPMWYKGGDNANGESKLAKRAFFNSDGYFKIAEYMHFCSRLLRPEPKEKGKAPAMIVFCAFDQIMHLLRIQRQGVCTGICHG
jgi:site-specific DNA-methyltransferase (adenine-specific)